MLGFYLLSKSIVVLKPLEPTTVGNRDTTMIFQTIFEIFNLFSVFTVLYFITRQLKCDCRLLPFNELTKHRTRYKQFNFSRFTHKEFYCINIVSLWTCGNIQNVNRKRHDTYHSIFAPISFRQSV